MEVACMRRWNGLAIALAACAAVFCTSTKGPSPAPGAGGARAMGGQTAPAAGGASAPAAGGTANPAGGATMPPDATAQGGAAVSNDATTGGAGDSGNLPDVGTAGSGGASTGGTTDGCAAQDAGASDRPSPDVPISGDVGDAIDVATCLDPCALGGPICCAPDLGCAKPGESCVFDMLAGSVSSPGLAYTYDTLEQRIAALSQEITVSVTDSDIEWAATDPSPSARIEMHLTAIASAQKGSLLAKSGPFRFSCDGTPLYVGQFYMLEGAAALATPVMHFAYDADNTVILRLGAVQGAWYTNFASQESKQRIDRPELRRLLCQRGDLRALAP